MVVLVTRQVSRVSTNAAAVAKRSRVLRKTGNPMLGDLQTVSREQTKAEILKFIAQFADIKDSFLYGKCYWFAEILMLRFEGGVPYYNQVDNHWVVKFGDTLYDASGEIEDTAGYEPWADVQVQEPALTKRLLKNCACFYDD